MSGDTTRYRFEPGKNYSGVYKQQGRVALDSDWNEGVEIDRRRARVEVLDLGARCFVPESTPDGFRITAGPGGELLIWPGRAYVDGLQAENHGLPPLSFDEVLDESRGTKPVPYVEQPYLDTDLLPGIEPTPGRADLVYLDVWSREVTAIEDPELLEIALGGADTTTRLQTVWQVKVLQGVEACHCGQEEPKYDEATRRSAGRLTTSVVTPPPSDDPCIVAPSGGYRGLENRQYRVQIHAPGPLGVATFKWSRDAASVVARVTEVSGTHRIVVQQLGRDETLRFDPGHWVELLDDALELAGQPGHMARIASVDQGSRTIELDRPVPASIDAADPGRHTRLVRWDQSLGVDANGLLTTAAGPIELEDGVQVSFGIDPEVPGGRMLTGDYWLAAARTADGSFEALVDAPPRGIHHHYCRLALVRWQREDVEPLVTDCRQIGDARCCCSVEVHPGGDVQAAIASLPVDGGEVVLLPGDHHVARPLVIVERENVRLRGCGLVSRLRLDEGLHVVGSRHIAITDLFVHTESSPTLVVVDEDSAHVELEDCYLMMWEPEKHSCVVTLGECRGVAVRGCVLFGATGVLHADLSDVSPLEWARKRLVKLRVECSGASDEDRDRLLRERLVAMRERGTRVGALRDLAVVGCELFVSRYGISLTEVEALEVVDDEIMGWDRRRPPRWAPEAPPTRVRRRIDHLEDATDDGAFHEETPEPSAYRAVSSRLDELRRAPYPCAGAVSACLCIEGRIARNRSWAKTGIEIGWSRDLRIEHERILATSRGVVLAYTLDTTIRDNRVTVSFDWVPPQEPLEPREPMASGEEEAEAEREMVEPGAAPPPPPLSNRAGGEYRSFDPRSQMKMIATSAAIEVWLAHGLRVRDNILHAPTGLGTANRALGECAEGRGRSVVRVLGLEPLFEAMTELAWVVWSIYLFLRRMTDNPPTAEDEAVTKDDIYDRLADGLLGLMLRLPAYVGKAVIADNEMVGGFAGVSLSQILTIAGIEIRGNRISGFEKVGIEVHPLMSIGRPDIVVQLIRCIIEVTADFLRRLRDQLRIHAGSETPAEEDEADVGATLISLLLALCRLMCPPSEDDDDGPADRPTLDDIADGIDDLLDALDPAELDDLHNQPYVIADNAVMGSGDGIISGIDGTRIVHNIVAVEPGTGIAREIVELGGQLVAASQQTSDFAGMRFGLAVMGLSPGMVLDAIERPAVDTVVPALESTLEGLDEGSALRLPCSQLRKSIETNNELLREDWYRFTQGLRRMTRGYGILIHGGDYACEHNRVEAYRGCKGLISKEGAAPAIGGIWQQPNLVALFSDLKALRGGGKGKKEAYALAAIVSVGLALGRWSTRALARRGRVVSNEVRRGLAHGISIEQAELQMDVEILDNAVVDASRHGIHFETTTSWTGKPKKANRAFFYGFDTMVDGSSYFEEVIALPPAGSSPTVEAHRNSITRSAMTFEPPFVDGDWSHRVGVRLLYVVDDAWQLHSLSNDNHGILESTSQQWSGFDIRARTAMVNDNHVLTNGLAIGVFALSGIAANNLHRLSMSTAGLVTRDNILI